MAVRFVLGRGGYGKTSVCLNEICSQLRASATGSPLIWIVPEQGSFQAEYAIVSRPELRGSMRAEVLSFRRLAHRLMQQERGTSRVYIDDAGKQMILLKAVHVVGERLNFYRATTISDGLLEQMGRLFAEWKRNGVSEERLASFADEQEQDEAQTVERSLAAKLRDLLLIYQSYEAELAKHYVDAEDDLILLANLIERSAHIRQAEIWLDGFHGFTSLELNVLTQLAIHCRRLTITLCLDREYSERESLDELNLFHRTAVTYKQLRAMCAKFGVQVEATLDLNGTARAMGPTGARYANNAEHVLRRQRSSALVHLESTFEQRPAIAYRGEMDGLTLCPAVNRRVEIETAAIEISRLAREEGARWRDMALMMRNIDDYLPLIREIFPKYEIPFFSDQKRSVADHPLVEFVRASLQTVQRYWRYDDLFRAIKTGFFVPNKSEEEQQQLQTDIDLLENVVLAAGLERRRWLHDTYWEKPLRINGSTIDGATWKRLLQCRKLILQPLLKLQKGLTDCNDVRSAVQVLYDYLCDLRVPETCERMGERRRQAGDLEAAQDNAAIWTSIIHILDQNVEILGDMSFRTNQWVRTFDRALESLKVGFVPPSLDQVLVGSLDRTRAGDVQYMFLVGVNEGVLPAKVTEKGLLSDRERNLLIAADIPLSPASLRMLLDESFLLYTTIATCVRRLRVSYALGNESGKGLIASGWIGQLYQMFPVLKETWHLVELDYATMGIDALRQSLQHPQQALQAWIENGERIIGQSLHKVPALERRLQRLDQAAAYRNETKRLTTEAVRGVYGEQWKGSVSRFELFSKCAFAHFARYGLRLREREAFELKPMHTGSLYHEVIETVIKQCKDEGCKLSDLDEQQLATKVDEALQSAVGNIQHAILTSSIEQQYTLEKLTRVVTETLTGIAAHERVSSFETAALEWAFEQRWESFTLQGVVDRLDVATDSQGRKWLRVIDYKSGGKKLDLNQLYHGISLQLLAYLDIASEQAETLLGDKAEVAGAFYFHIHDKVEPEPHPLTPDEQAKQDRKRYRMSGYVVDEMDVIRMMDHELHQPKTESSVLPVQTVDSGALHGRAKAHLLTSEQWQQLRTFVRTKMGEIGQGIQSGGNAIRPHKLGSTNACEYCDFKSVCQFDRTLPHQSFRYLTKAGKDEVLEKMSGV